MPARSQAQQRAAVKALAARRGEIDPRDLVGGAAGMYRSMTDEMLVDLATTQVDDLPERKR